MGKQLFADDKEAHKSSTVGKRLDGCDFDTLKGADFPYTLTHTDIEEMLAGE